MMCPPPEIKAALAAFALMIGGAGCVSVRESGPEATTGEERRSLNGEWRFTIDATRPEAAWDRITVPGNWDTLPAYSTHRGKGWYQRAFEVPPHWAGQSVRLRFEAVYHHAEVTLNGEVLGEHIGGYTPFEFDVTGRLRHDGPNIVRVRADNGYRRGAWWPWGGISRDVTLIANREARIVWQHIRSEPDLERGTARVSVRYKLANTGAKPLAVKLRSDIRPASGATLQGAVTLAPRSEQVLELATTLPAGDVRLWHFDHPNLYTFHTRVTSASGELLHAKTDRFGIRKVEITPDSLLLNGERIRAPGFNRVSDSNATGSTEPDELVRKDVDLMKQAGAVFSRLMHNPLAPNLLDYLDEKGMLIIAEIPVWGTDPQVFPGNPLTRQWLREMIERDFNHPSIIGWSPANETSNHYGYVESMLDYIRDELDDSRLLGYASFTSHRDDYGPDKDPTTVCDLAMINVYGEPDGAFTTTPAIVRERWPDKAIFFAEFGYDQIGAASDATIPKLAEIWEKIESLPHVIGASLWTYNDYRSDYRGTPASGNREWGVVDMERRPKAAYWDIRKRYSPARSLTLRDGIATLEPRGPEEIPSYTLRGYSLAWSLRDAKGKIVKEGVVPVPELRPGAPAWSVPIPGAATAAGVTLSLRTPTGYDVRDLDDTP